MLWVTPDHTAKSPGIRHVIYTMEHEYHFNVKMNCGACSNAIERVLSKLEGACFLRLTYTRCDVAGDKSGEANGKEVISGQVVA